jgi:hypothetical protein
MSKKIVAGIATFQGREQQLKQTIKSIENQVDQIFLYNNKYMKDLTDNGKFHGLTLLKEPAYYFSIDDDLLYPPTYVQDTLQKLKKYQTIVTYHGRILTGPHQKYYKAPNKSYRCLNTVDKDILIDVAGTGVTAFDTEYFNPTNIPFSKYKKMSDIIFSLEAAKQKKAIILLSHIEGYIKQLPIEESIYSSHVNNDSTQAKLAAQIFHLQPKYTIRQRYLLDPR